MHRPYGTARAVATGAILLACGRACDAAREVSLANLVDVSWEPAGSAAIEFHVRQRAGPAEGLRGLALVVGGSGSEASAFVASWDSRTASGGLVQQVGQTSGATWMASHDVGPPAAAEVHVEPGGLLSFSFVSPLAPKCGGPGDKASPGPLRVPAVASLVDRLRQRSLRSAAGAGALGLPRCEGADLAAPGATLTLHAAFLVEDSALSATAGGPSSLVVAASTAPATFDLRTGAPARARAASSEASAPVAQPSRRSAMVMAGANLTTSEMAMGSMHTAFFDQGYGWGPLMFQQAYITSGGELAAAIILCGLFGAFATATVVAGKRLESIGSSPAASLGWVAVGVVSTAIRTGSHYVAMLLVMTFNVWIVLAVIIGQAIGFALLVLLGRIGLRQGWFVGAQNRGAPAPEVAMGRVTGDEAWVDHADPKDGNGHGHGLANGNGNGNGKAHANGNGHGPHHGEHSVGDSARAGSEAGSCCSSGGNGNGGNNDSVSVGKKFMQLLPMLMEGPESRPGGGRPGSLRGSNCGGADGGCGCN